MAKVLGFTSSISGPLVDRIRDIVTGAGHEYVQGPSYFGIPSEEDVTDSLLQIMPEIAGVILGGQPVNRTVIERSPELKVIARTGVGFDAVDHEAAAEHGVAVTITPYANADSVAEFAMLLALALSRQLPGNHKSVASGSFKRVMGRDIFGQTIGIVGLGRIGRRVTERAQAFGMKVIANEAYPDMEFVTSRGIELTDVDDLVSRADVVTLHAPNTPETYHLINAERLATMKPTAILVNTARGQLIDEKALAAALRSGQIGGAGLDVFESEPLEDDSPLRGLDNLIMAPHVAGVTSESTMRMAEDAAHTAVDVLSGSWPREVVVNGVYSH
ncbi:MAG: phosphoglycerate dehydrogenase [Chloroflexi bacterium]|nr:phosphoglycerate dehydrogenase [Chloroflexota bacterium]